MAESTASQHKRPRFIRRKHDESGEQEFDNWNRKPEFKLDTSRTGYLTGFKRRGELVLEIVKDYFTLGFQEFEVMYGVQDAEEAIRKLDE